MIINNNEYNIIKEKNNTMNKPLLILDLDETLIYSSYEADAKYDFIIDDTYYVKKRPYVEDFLQEMNNYFDLAVWTAATRDYAQIIVNELFVKQNIQLKFFHSRERCVEKDNTRSMYDSYVTKYYIKDLKKIKKHFDLNKVLFVDDLTVSLQRNYGNLIKIPPFQGESEDNYLLLLKQYLLSIKEKENLRKIEKRFWQNNLQTPGKKFKF